VGDEDSAAGTPGYTGDTGDAAEDAGAVPQAGLDALHALDALRESMRGTLIERMQIELLSAAPDRVVARMPVSGNTQPYGLLHGGASVALAETVGSIAAMLHAGTGRIAVGVDINATHHRAVTEGFVTGTATPLSQGRTVASYQIAIDDATGRRVCTARLTCLLRVAAP